MELHQDNMGPAATSIATVSYKKMVAALLPVRTENIRLRNGGHLLLAATVTRVTTQTFLEY